MRKLTAVLLLAVLLVACGGDDDPVSDEQTPTTAVTSTTEAAEEDPYETYLRLKPAGEGVLSRDDAQARAYLGCDKQWAPGTTDRALADAYRPTGICD